MSCTLFVVSGNEMLGMQNTFTGSLFGEAQICYKPIARSKDQSIFFLL